MLSARPTPTPVAPVAVCPSASTLEAFFAELPRLTPWAMVAVFDEDMRAVVTESKSAMASAAATLTLPSLVCAISE